MQYIQFEADGPAIRELDVDSFIAEAGAHYLCELYDDNVCAYSFDACIAAGFLAQQIIVNTPELYDLCDEYKQGIQQAAILTTMAERNGEVDELMSVILRGYLEKLRTSMLIGALEVVLFSPRKMKLVHDSHLTVYMAFQDAVRMALMITPKPKEHVHSDRAWMIAKYTVHTAAAVLRTEFAQNLYDKLLPIWQSGLATGGLEFVHPISSQILAQQKIISDAVADIKKISDLCKHPESEVLEVRKGDSGNWSISDDSESIEHTCKICGRNWYYNKYHGDKEFKLVSTSQKRLPIKQ